mmetsp:Transcript_23010/g.74510  ORF Transcript_23010/g.74510 Transcript_23010/m.74510 type:complete len:105 (-) Transcript_23010:337-651(-)
MVASQSQDASTPVETHPNHPGATPTMLGTLMLSVLVPPAASYMYYRPMVSASSLSHFGSFSSPFDSMFDDLLCTSRALAAPTFGHNVLDVPLHSQLSSLMRRFD